MKKVFNVTVHDDRFKRSFAVVAVDPIQAREIAETNGWEVASCTIFELNVDAVTSGSVQLLPSKAA